MTKKESTNNVIPLPPKRDSGIPRNEITPELLLEIQNMAAIGWSSRQIADWLEKKKGIKYSHVTIANKLRRNKKERKVYSEEILKPYLEKTLTGDLELLESIIQDAQKVLKDAQKAGDERLVLQAIDRLDKLINTRRKFCGIDEKTETQADDAVDINYKEMADRFNFPKPHKDAMRADLNARKAEKELKKALPENFEDLASGED